MNRSKRGVFPVAVLAIVISALGCLACGDEDGASECDPGGLEFDDFGCEVDSDCVSNLIPYCFKTEMDFKYSCINSSTAIPESLDCTGCDMTPLSEVINFCRCVENAGGDGPPMMCQGFVSDAGFSN